MFNTEYKTMGYDLNENGIEWGIEIEIEYEFDDEFQPVITGKTERICVSDNNDRIYVDTEAEAIAYCERMIATWNEE